MLDCSPTDLAYCAGIIDGEGCLTISRTLKRGHPTHHARILVLNTSAPLIHWLVAHFGGSVCPHNSRNATHGNPNANPSRWKACWEWKCSEREVDAILTALLPYLVVKRDQAVLMLEFRRTMQRKGVRRLPTPQTIIQHRDDLHQQLRVVERTR